MIRSWGQVTLTGSAQPLFGDVLTAALNNVKPHNGFYIVTVASTTRYQVGDRIIVGVGSGNPTTCLLVEQIKDSTHLYCTSEGNAAVSAWAIGTLLALSIACGEVTLQSILGNAGLVWLGSDSTVTNVGGGSAFAQVTQAGSYSFGIPQWNCVRTSDMWIAGTVSDKVGVAAIVN